MPINNEELLEQELSKLQKIEDLIQFLKNNRDFYFQSSRNLSFQDRKSSDEIVGRINDKIDSLDAFQKNKLKREKTKKFNKEKNSTSLKYLLGEIQKLIPLQSIKTEEKKEEVKTQDNHQPPTVSGKSNVVPEQQNKKRQKLDTKQTGTINIKTKSGSAKTIQDEIQKLDLDSLKDKIREIRNEYRKEFFDSEPVHSYIQTIEKDLQSLEQELSKSAELNKTKIPYISGLISRANSTMQRNKEAKFNRNVPGTNTINASTTQVSSSNDDAKPQETGKGEFQTTTSTVIKAETSSIQTSPTLESDEKSLLEKMKEKRVKIKEQVENKNTTELKVYLKAYSEQHEDLLRRSDNQNLQNKFNALIRHLKETEDSFKEYAKEGDETNKIRFYKEGAVNVIYELLEAIEFATIREEVKTKEITQLKPYLQGYSEKHIDLLQKLHNQQLDKPDDSLRSKLATLIMDLGFKATDIENLVNLTQKAQSIESYKDYAIKLISELIEAIKDDIIQQEEAVNNEGSKNKTPKNTTNEKIKQKGVGRGFKRLAPKQEAIQKNQEKETPQTTTQKLKLSVDPELANQIKKIQEEQLAKNPPNEDAIPLTRGISIANSFQQQEKTQEEKKSQNKNQETENKTRSAKSESKIEPTIQEPKTLRSEKIPEDKIQKSSHIEKTETPTPQNLESIKEADLIKKLLGEERIDKEEEEPKRQGDKLLSQKVLEKQDKEKTEKKLKDQEALKIKRRQALAEQRTKFQESQNKKNEENELWKTQDKIKKDINKKVEDQIREEEELKRQELANKILEEQQKAELKRKEEDEKKNRQLEKQKRKEEEKKLKEVQQKEDTEIKHTTDQPQPNITSQGPLNEIAQPGKPISNQLDPVEQITREGTANQSNEDDLEKIKAENQKETKEEAESKDTTQENLDMKKTNIPVNDKQEIQTQTPDKTEKHVTRSGEEKQNAAAVIPNQHQKHNQEIDIKQVNQEQTGIQNSDQTNAISVQIPNVQTDLTNVSHDKIVLSPTKTEIQKNQENEEIKPEQQQEKDEVEDDLLKQEIKGKFEKKIPGNNQPPEVRDEGLEEEIEEIEQDLELEEIKDELEEFEKHMKERSSGYSEKNDQTKMESEKNLDEKPNQEINTKDSKEDELPNKMETDDKTETDYDYKNAVAKANALLEWTATLLGSNQTNDEPMKKEENKAKKDSETPEELDWHKTVIEAGKERQNAIKILMDYREKEAKELREQIEELEKYGQELVNAINESDQKFAEDKNNQKLELDEGYETLKKLQEQLLALEEAKRKMQEELEKQKEQLQKNNEDLKKEQQIPTAKVDGNKDDKNKITPTGGEIHNMTPPVAQNDVSNSNEPDNVRKLLEGLDNLKKKIDDQSKVLSVGLKNDGKSDSEVKPKSNDLQTPSLTPESTPASNQDAPEQNLGPKAETPADQVSPQSQQAALSSSDEKEEEEAIVNKDKNDNLVVSEDVEEQTRNILENELPFYSSKDERDKTPKNPSGENNGNQEEVSEIDNAKFDNEEQLNEKKDQPNQISVSKEEDNGELAGSPEQTSSEEEEKKEEISQSDSEKVPNLKNEKQTDENLETSSSSEGEEQEEDNSIKADLNKSEKEEEESEQASSSEKQLELISLTNIPQPNTGDENVRPINLDELNENVEIPIDEKRDEKPITLSDDDRLTKALDKLNKRNKTPKEESNQNSDENGSEETGEEEEQQEEETNAPLLENPQGISKTPSISEESDNEKPPTEKNNPRTITLSDGEDDGTLIPGLKNDEEGTNLANTEPFSGGGGEEVAKERLRQLREDLGMDTTKIPKTEKGGGEQPVNRGEGKRKKDEGKRPNEDLLQKILDRITKLEDQQKELVGEIKRLEEERQKEERKKPQNEKEGAPSSPKIMRSGGNEKKDEGKEAYENLRKLLEKQIDNLQKEYQKLTEEIKKLQKQKKQEEQKGKEEKKETTDTDGTEKIKDATGGGPGPSQDRSDINKEKDRAELKRKFIELQTYFKNLENKLPKLKNKYTQGFLQTEIKRNLNLIDSSLKNLETEEKSKLKRTLEACAQEYKHLELSYYKALVSIGETTPPSPIDNGLDSNQDESDPEKEEELVATLKQQLSILQDMFNDLAASDKLNKLTVEDMKWVTDSINRAIEEIDYQLQRQPEKKKNQLPGQKKLSDELKEVLTHQGEKYNNIEKYINSETKTLDSSKSPSLKPPIPTPPKVPSPPLSLSPTVPLNWNDLNTSEQYKIQLLFGINFFNFFSEKKEGYQTYIESVTKKANSISIDAEFQALRAETDIRLQMLIAYQKHLESLGSKTSRTEKEALPKVKSCIENLDKLLNKPEGMLHPTKLIKPEIILLNTQIKYEILDADSDKTIINKTLQDLGIGDPSAASETKTTTEIEGVETDKKGTKAEVEKNKIIITYTENDTTDTKIKFLNAAVFHANKPIAELHTNLNQIDDKTILIAPRTTVRSGLTKVSIPHDGLIADAINTLIILKAKNFKLKTFYLNGNFHEYGPLAADCAESYLIAARYLRQVIGIDIHVEISPPNWGLLKKCRYRKDTDVSPKELELARKRIATEGAYTKRISFIQAEEIALNGEQKKHLEDLTGRVNEVYHKPLFGS